YATVALVALLVITLTSGGVFYFLRANDSQTVNQILNTTQQQLNNTHPTTDPASALNALSTAQKTLSDLQNHHQLDVAQQQRIAKLQDQLVRQVNVAILAYNQHANIFVLDCVSKPINNGSTDTSPQSIAYAQNAQGAPFLYTLAQNKGVYQINS